MPEELQMQRMWVDAEHGPLFLIAIKQLILEAHVITETTETKQNN